MSQTKKIVIFLLSFFIAVFTLSFAFQKISFLLVDTDPNIINNIISPLLITLGILFLILIQTIIKYIVNKKILKTNESLASASITKFKAKERFLPYTLLIIVYIIPLTREFVFNNTTIIRLLLFIGAVMIIEVILRISNKNIKIYFLKNGVLILGFDTRIEIPLGTSMNLYNDSGFYSYSYLKEYLILQDRIILFLRNDYGQIEFLANNELKRQFTGLMAQNKIPVRKVHN